MKEEEEIYFEEIKKMVDKGSDYFWSGRLLAERPLEDE